MLRGPLTLFERLDTSPLTGPYSQPYWPRPAPGLTLQSRLRVDNSEVERTAATTETPRVEVADTRWVRVGDARPHIMLTSRAETRESAVLDSALCALG